MINITGQREKRAALLTIGFLVFAFAFWRPLNVEAQWTSPDASGNTNTTGSGNVGVGTTTPAILGTGARGIHITGSGVAGLRLDTVAGGGHAYEFESINSGNLGLYDLTAAAYRLYVTGNGNIGIGTVNPTTKLTVTDGVAPYAAGATDLLQLKRNTYNNGATGGVSVLFANNSNGFRITYGGTSDRLGFVDGGNVEVFSLLNGGNLGIGTTNPGEKLELYDATASVRLKINAAGASANSYLVMNSAGQRASIIQSQTGGANAGQIVLYASNDSYGRLFGVDSTNNFGDIAAELMIKRNGSIGVGTTNPAFDANTTRYLSLDGGSGGFGSFGVGGNISSTAYPVGQMAFFNSNLGIAEKRIATIVGRTDGAVNSGAIDFYTWNAGSLGGAPKVTIASIGNVGIGVVTPAYKLDVAGQIRSSTGGFVFPDGTVQTTAATGGAQWTTSGSNIYYNTGSVGIGTAPSTFLDLKGNNIPYAGQLRIQASDYGQITFYNSSNPTIGAAGRRGEVYYDFANNLLVVENSNGGAYNGSILMNPLGGTVGIGTATPDTNYKLDVAGSVKVSGNIAAKYQDVAEWVESTQKLSAGTVVVLDSERINQVIASTQAYDTRVAGVVSDSPGVILGEGGEGKVKVATTGRVRIRVDATRAPIRIGDLLVTSNEEGLAMKSEPINFNGRMIHTPGTIIGKALEPLEKGRGEILVLLSLQ